MSRQCRLFAVALAVLLGTGVPPRAADQNAVRKAIEKGVAHLKQEQRGNGAWPFPATDLEFTAPQQVGASALAGLTLLECGVRPADAAVQRTAQMVRQSAPQLTYTYALATSILFLNRLGEPKDVPVIHSLSSRLLAGQNYDGGWSYTCPGGDDPDVQQLNRQLQTMKNARPATQAPATPAPSAPDLRRNRFGRRRGPDGVTDNSNTKFATLALWVARRHGLPVEQALSRVDSRFRKSANDDGGWGYWSGGQAGGRLTESTGPMTGAALLGLGFGQGSAAEATLRAESNLNRTPTRPAHNVDKDPLVRNGLNYLGIILGQPFGHNGPLAPITNPKEGDVFYFLWVVERVAMAYNLNDMGGKDWYDIGSKFLLGRQDSDGGWRGKYGKGGVDTCFALLFLRRANLSQDLTAILRGSGVGLDAARQELNRPAEPDPAPANPPKGTDVGKQGPAEDGKEDTGTEKTPAEKSPARKVDVRRPPEPAPGSPPGGDTPRSPGGFEARVKSLSAELVGASADAQADLLKKYREGRGPEYTQALAEAARELNGRAKTRARDALAERLARMTASTLRERLRDDDAELRRAAALACAVKDDKSHVPDLIPILEDSKPTVAQAARVALRTLTGEDFGPKSLNPTRDELRIAVTQWKRWWQDHSEK